MKFLVNYFRKGQVFYCYSHFIINIYNTHSKLKFELFCTPIFFLCSCPKCSSVSLIPISNVPTPEDELLGITQHSNLQSLLVFICLSFYRPSLLTLYAYVLQEGGLIYTGILYHTHNRLMMIIVSWSVFSYLSDWRVWSAYLDARFSTYPPPVWGSRDHAGAQRQRSMYHHDGNADGGRKKGALKKYELNKVGNVELMQSYSTRRWSATESPVSQHSFVAYKTRIRWVMWAQRLTEQGGML